MVEVDSRDVGDGSPWERIFRENLLRTRRGKRMSQSELAKRVTRAGVASFHQQTVQRIESGERPVRLNEAFGIAQALDVSFDDMMNLTTPEAIWGAIKAHADGLVMDLEGLGVGRAQQALVFDMAELEALATLYEELWREAGHSSAPGIQKVRYVTAEGTKALKALDDLATSISKMNHPAHAVRGFDSLEIPDGVDPEA